jgi:beta-galactosidase/beta-glucuronidase
MQANVRLTGPEGPRPEYPRPHLKRSEWLNLNGEWEFGAGEKPTFDRRIVVPFCAESELSGIGQLPGDVVWYRREFDAPEAECLLLHFGAVDYRATVWVNDVEVAGHEGGHSPFSADITRASRARNNLLVVKAEDPLRDKTIPRGKQYWTEQPEGIFYTPTTGIWQTVWLEPLPARHIRHLHLSPDLADGLIDFDIEGEGEAELVATLDEVVVGRWSGPAGPGRMHLDRVVAWHPDSPQLYQLEARLLDQEGKAADRVNSYFGLRTIETRDGRFWLNGEPYVQRLILDQGYFPGGLLTAPSDEAIRRDIELAQAFGFNGARKHQKAEDPRWLYWADRLGFLVWSEMPSFHEHSAAAERRLAAEWKQLVLRDRDHPSIVAWVVANESFGLDHVDPSVRSSFLLRLCEATHALDRTRPVVSNDGWEHALSDLCTIHDYSQPAALARRFRSIDAALDRSGHDHAVYDPGYDYRGEPLLVSEFGGIRVSGQGGWGWLEVDDRDQFLDLYRGLVGALMESAPVQGFCYTQLTDVEQEQNGLLTFDREPKVDPDRIRSATQTVKRA